jgi:hypothetical protein
MRYFFLLMLLVADERTTDLVEQVATSGQVAEIAMSSSERVTPQVQIAPGAAPALGFRVIEGKLRHRFGDLDLVLDDAGH